MRRAILGSSAMWLAALGCNVPAPSSGASSAGGQVERPPSGEHATSSSPGEGEDGRGTWGDACPDHETGSGGLPARDEVSGGTRPRSSPCGGGEAFECDLHTQDCPDNERCAPWANDGTFVWNAVRCSPLADEPGERGERCEMDGGGSSGVSSCGVGMMCFDVDRSTLTGRCVGICESSDHCTANEVCVSLNDGALPVCLPACDPLGPSCAAERSCVPVTSSQSWVCLRAARPLAAVSESCDHLNDCEPGAFCLVSTGAGGTWPEGRCAVGCDPSADVDPCGDGESCWPLPPGTDGPLASATFGVCGRAPAVEPWLGASLPAAADAGP